MMLHFRMTCGFVVYRCRGCALVAHRHAGRGVQPLIRISAVAFSQSAVNIRAVPPPDPGAFVNTNPCGVRGMVTKSVTWVSIMTDYLVAYSHAVRMPNRCSYPMDLPRRSPLQNTYPICAVYVRGVMKCVPLKVDRKLYRATSFATFNTVSRSVTRVLSPRSKLSVPTPMSNTW